MKGEPKDRGICQVCGELKKLDIHHKDGNHSNDIEENRVALCRKCHHHAHISLLFDTTGRVSTRPLSERTFEAYEPIAWSEVKRQYSACFPRA